MKILLTAINAKYIHTNPAIYSLKAYAEEYIEKDANISLETVEYTINQQPDDIMTDIYGKNADVLCFSCYIWNISCVALLVREIKKVRPNMQIWLGGPEVSYDSRKTLERLPEVTGIMKGEGEVSFLNICKAYAKGRIEDDDFEKINGIAYKKADGSVTDCPWQSPVDMDSIPFIWYNIDDFEHKIIYYETSRGCPFSCSYCLSSIDKKLRFRKLELVKRELQFFLDHKAAQVKFVDRTFNCNHKHAMEIWSYLAEHDNKITNFHFEISADLLNEQEISLLRTMRPGLIQLEIGVQSTNQDTIKEIRRTMDFAKVSDAVFRIREAGNIHQHLDLIAGLPFEDLESFEKSFNDVYALKPEQLQLGFLKVLKGSYMEEKKEEYGIACKDAPPYEVLFTKWLSYGDVIRLKGIEKMVEIYYNSRQFEHTIEELGREYDSAFVMYEEIWRFYRENNIENVKHKRSDRYEILLAFIEKRYPGRKEYFRELLIWDYYLRENAKTRPRFAGPDMMAKEAVRRFYEKEAEEHSYLPGLTGYDKNQMRRMTHVEYFQLLDQMLLFDYTARNPLNQEARTCRLAF